MSIFGLITPFQNNFSFVYFKNFGNFFVRVLWSEHRKQKANINKKLKNVSAIKIDSKSFIALNNLFSHCFTIGIWNILKFVALSKTSINLETEGESLILSIFLRFPTSWSIWNILQILSIYVFINICRSKGTINANNIVTSELIAADSIIYSSISDGYTGTANEVRIE